MSGENAANMSDATQDEADGRQRSSIGFPYNNLGDAIEIAQAIHDNAGTGDCDDVQLSAWLNMSSKSSGYRIQLSASRMFALVETTAGRHRLTPLGRSIVDPQQERAARANAFLSVPLYKVIYDNYKGGVLPPAAALERDMIGFGVAEKQTGRARQVFERSADQANFFEHGKNRLVMPAVALREKAPESSDEKDKSNGRRAGNGADNCLDEMGLDPLLVALLKKIPTSGEWPAQQRLRWFRTFAMNVSQIYDVDDHVPVEMKIELEN